MANQDTYTVDDLAKLWHMHRDYIWTIRARGELRGLKQGHRRVFTADEVAAFLRRHSKPELPGEPSAAEYYASWPREPGRVQPVAE